MKKVLLVIGVFIGSMLSSTLVSADTYVNGVIDASTTWTSAGSPYIVVDYVSTAPGVTLTIEGGVEVRFLGGNFQSHQTHFDSTGKGPGITECTDCHESEPGVKVGACDACHSPGGAFDGVDDPDIGALPNWADSIYASDGKLKPGKENWCLSCHDDDPNTTDTNESALIGGIYGPNIAGDENSTDTYGFNLTGHKINCLSCHDASKKHIDHEHRTYDADESTGQAINPYSDSYRLQGTNSMPSTALCLDCHNGDEVLGEDRWDVSHTNLWGTNPIWSTSYGNGHNYHIDIWSRHFDSDWDGVTDSRESCIACHNVHGSPARRMIRHGELISTYGTEDKVPALDFGYLVPAPGFVATAAWPAPEGTYYVYAWWSAHSNRATNAPYTINHSGGFETIPVNQEENGGQWNQLGAVTYAFVAGNCVVLSNEGADEYVIADAIGFDRDGIFDPDPEIVIDNDNPSVTYSPEAWTSCSGNPDKYGADLHYHAKQQGTSMDRNATLQQSVGGRIDLAGPNVSHNGVCTACHGGISYERVPYLDPKVIDAKANPKTVAPDGMTEAILTAFVLDHNDNVSSVTVDLSDIDGGSAETMYDDGINGGDATAGDKIYTCKTTVPDTVASGLKSLMVTATDADGDGKGEIVMKVAMPGEIIMDNPEATFVGNWPSNSTNADRYGDDLRYNAAGVGSDTATWKPDIPKAGNYAVYAWWHAYSNRATDAPYTIHHKGGFETVRVNQEINGGQWNWLGTWNFDEGTSGYVVLSDNANEYVIADAIKWELQP